MERCCWYEFNQLVSREKGKGWGGEEGEEKESNAWGGVGAGGWWGREEVRKGEKGVWGYLQ